MRTMKVTEKEADGISCMIAFWYDVNMTFKTLHHGMFNDKDFEQLIKKLEGGA